MEIALYSSLALNAVLVAGLLWNQGVLTKEISRGRESLLAKTLTEMRSVAQKPVSMESVSTGPPEVFDMNGEYDPNYVPEGFSIEGHR